MESKMVSDSPLNKSKRSLTEDSKDLSTKRQKTQDATAPSDTKSTNQDSELNGQEPLIEKISTVFAQIKPLIASFSFSAKLMSKSAVEKQYYAQGDVFDFEMMDQTGKIRGKVYNEHCAVVHPKLIVGRTYTFTGALISASSPNNGPTVYEVIFDSETEITEIKNDFLAKLENKYNVTDYSKLLTLPTL